MKIEINELSHNSIVDHGDPSRIKIAMQKALKGETVCIGAMGGSITQGASASAVEKRYMSLIADWWKAKFPAAEIKLVNAGIGATGSLLGVHRVQNDLLRFEPDFVVVEYAVNDENVPITGMVYEGLLRRILSSSHFPGAFLIFMMNNTGQNAQEIQQKVGAHYDLPMVSFRDAIWPEIQKDSIKWDDVEADEVHPNDYGHELVARFVTDRLEEILAGLDPNEAIDIKKELPPPLISDDYENSAIIGNLEIKPIANEGWEESKTLIFKNGWVAGKSGGSIVFEVDAKSIGVIYKKFNTNNMGRAEIQVDDMEPVLLEGHFPCYWGGYAHAQIIANHLPSGVHRVHRVAIKFLADHDPESTGTEFMVCGLLIAR